MGMTEIEARSKIKYRIATAMSLVGTGEDGKAYEDLEIALQALKEIREYRELGTVEDIQLIFSLCKDLERIVKKYEAIGTVEEFKALKEKGIPIIHGKAELELHDKKVRTKAIDEAIETSAKAICVGCGYLDGHKCNYKGGNCGVSKPMLETVVKALEKMKGGATDEG